MSDFRPNLLGQASWIFMESVSPLSFIAVYLFAPFSSTGSPPPLRHPSTILAAFFLLHYLNRAILSPLRAPGRSRAHIAVVIAATIFNAINPPLMASYLSASPSSIQKAAEYLHLHLREPMVLVRPDAWHHPAFWVGLTMFVSGLVSNIVHDEMLYNLRRNHPPGPDGKPHYAIPHGLLYEYISFPNYFSEWFEWTGYAIGQSVASNLGLPLLIRSIAASAGQRHLAYTPPWMFLVAEIMVMLPRAYRGHQWYKKKFPDYPKDRKAVIPFLY